ncbi:diguanylate cyclase domain-containing protein [Paenibacillus hexagrammi]|uniref:Diguanylate cyclase n=1 Tax=Paenibacillus hexagrammi TaxID=2908839 RepID=A0ABY3SBZ3_9BACL|nr:diguanylate cyclase [Paenibacillus sp. YPD9-1]UJF31463.1 diguanylate cyclase [Paenibacillus sp. YPD9-1]
MSKKTIGVLTALTDGFYFNGMLQGIHKAALEHNVNVVNIQTYDSAHVNQYRGYLGCEYVDGWIVLLNAITDPEHIARLEASGKPVVCTPDSSGFAECTTFIIDNEQGGYEAARHMIEHGHRRIAFVQCSNNPEIMLRFQGYLRALQEFGIPFDEGLIYDVPNLWEKYGKEVAEQMKQRGFDFTSVVISADLTAVGIMESFQSFGVRVPEDIAVFSFDNTEYARRLHLSSVAQPLFERGRDMCEYLLRRFEGMPSTGPVIVNKMQPVFRQSCGCSVPSEPENMDTLYSDGLEMIEFLSNAIQRNHHIGGNLIRSNPEEIRDMTWLSYTPYTWGCLALWNTDQSDVKTLRIDNIFSRKQECIVEVGEIFAEEAFPPAWLGQIVEANESLTVHTLKTEKRDFGFIVLIGNIFDKSHTSSLGPLIHSVRHTLDLLAHALERETLYEEARQREHRLEIVSSATNDGIFDWDLDTNLIEWNRKINHILDHEGLMMQASEFIQRIHPDDWPGLRDAMMDHYRHGTHFQREFRMLKNQKDLIWISAAGEAVRDQKGQPIRMIGSIVDITVRKKAEEDIYFIAYHDALTGLSNRRYIYNRITEELAQEENPLAVIMLDLDRFKVVNDSLGHLVGDQLLCQIARLLERSVGPLDIVGRLGGDEFIIICTKLQSYQYAETVAQSILRALNAPLNIDGHLVYATPSIGICFCPEHGSDRESLIQYADIAMYQAKENGKNRYHVYSQEMNEDSLQKLTMEGCLRGALKQANSNCTISRKWSFLQEPSSGWRRCCVGLRRYSAKCRPENSYRLPKKRG